MAFRQEIEETVIKQEEGSEFHTKKITRVTSETKWLGGKQKPTGPKQPFLETDGGALSAETSQVEANPLYSSSDYVTDFSNPLYTNRQSTAEAAALAASEQIEMDDMTPLVSSGGGRGARGKPPKPGSEDQGKYLPYLSAQPEAEMDVLY